MEATRRGFLRVTTGAISGLSLAGPTTRALGGVQQRIRQRKDVSQLNSSSPDIVALTTAVGKMKAGLGDGDRRNWEAQAQIHGTFTGGSPTASMETGISCPGTAATSTSSRKSFVS